MNEDDKNKINFDALTEKLPPDLMDAIYSANTPEIIERISKKYGLLIDKMGLLAEETGLVMFGITHPSDFIANLKQKLGVGQETARKIAEDVNQQIFAKVRESLKKLHGMGDSEEEKTTPVEPKIELKPEVGREPQKTPQIKIPEIKTPPPAIRSEIKISPPIQPGKTLVIEQPPTKPPEVQIISEKTIKLETKMPPLPSKDVEMKVPSIPATKNAVTPPAPPKLPEYKPKDESKPVIPKIIADIKPTIPENQKILPTDSKEVKTTPPRIPPKVPPPPSAPMPVPKFEIKKPVSDKPGKKELKPLIINPMRIEFENREKETPEPDKLADEIRKIIPEQIEPKKEEDRKDKIEAPKAENNPPAPPPGLAFADKTSEMIFRTPPEITENKITLESNKKGHPRKEVKPFSEIKQEVEEKNIDKKPDPYREKME
ncbi:hypothetical protein HYW53_01245 [Candidatus Giovannonibacteria bacterium]|nr:hypothetical protein [Candidatus Giovannonibacteria bacterium]